MTQHEITYDRRLIGQFLERMVERKHTWSKFAALADVSRASLHRMQTGDPRVTVSTMRKVEEGLSLPFDTFQLVAVHDLGGLRELGIEAGVLEWLGRQIKDSAEADAASASSRSSTRATSRG